MSHYHNYRKELWDFLPHFSSQERKRMTTKVFTLVMSALTILAISVGYFLQ